MYTIVAPNLLHIFQHTLVREQHAKTRWRVLNLNIIIIYYCYKYTYNRQRKEEKKKTVHTYIFILNLLLYFSRSTFDRIINEILIIPIHARVLYYIYIPGVRESESEWVSEWEREWASERERDPSSFPAAKSTNTHLEIIGSRVEWSAQKPLARESLWAPAVAFVCYDHNIFAGL